MMHDSRGSGQTGAAVNFWQSSQDPKKAEIARLPKKTKPYAFGYRSAERREQVNIPADHVLVDRQALAVSTSEVPAYFPGAS
jgi:hypothetical protein